MKLVICLALLTLGVTANAQKPPAPLAANHVVIGERIHTAGQPTAETLAGLAGYGFGLVVNLAPPTAPDAVAEEANLVAAAGAAYVNIPVNWQQPTAADFDRFSEVMKAARNEKVLVHCQLNMRASTFTFLYRVVHENVAPEIAFEDLQKVWTPGDQWALFGNATLAQHDIDYRLPAAE
jgi:protein tyrosine phosphatase (PTP) superfamily phosphohydrolase (DUF442 family)